MFIVSGSRSCEVFLEQLTGVLQSLPELRYAATRPQRSTGRGIRVKDIDHHHNNLTIGPLIPHIGFFAPHSKSGHPL